MKNLTLHSEAETFVANAEKAFNAKDVDAAVAGYAPSAVVEFWTEGIYDRFEGIEQIKRAWEYAFTAFPDFRLTKTLVSADPAGAIINEWNGSISGRKNSYGIDMWWRNPAGEVTLHKILAHGNVVPYASWRGKMRWLFVHPTLGFRAVMARRKAGL